MRGTIRTSNGKTIRKIYKTDCTLWTCRTSKVFREILAIRCTATWPSSDCSYKRLALASSQVSFGWGSSPHLGHCCRIQRSHVTFVFRPVTDKSNNCGQSGVKHWPINAFGLVPTLDAAGRGLSPSVEEEEEWSNGKRSSAREWLNEKESESGSEWVRVSQFLFLSLSYSHSKKVKEREVESVMLWW